MGSRLLQAVAQVRRWRAASGVCNRAPDAAPQRRPVCAYVVPRRCASDRCRSGTRPRSTCHGHGGCGWLSSGMCHFSRLSEGIAMRCWIAFVLGVSCVFSARAGHDGRHGQLTHGRVKARMRFPFVSTRSREPAHTIRITGTRGRGKRAQGDTRTLCPGYTRRPKDRLVCAWGWWGGHARNQ